MEETSEEEEKVDKWDMTQAREAILTWEALRKEPDRKFYAPAIKKLMSFIPNKLMSRKYRKPINEAPDEQMFTYTELTKKFGLLAQNDWVRTLEEIPHESMLYLQAIEKKGYLIMLPAGESRTYQYSITINPEEGVVALNPASRQTR